MRVGQRFIFGAKGLSMASPSIRFVLCLVIGLFTGSTLGILFASDPTGIVAFGLAAVCTAGITGYLHRSDWLRD